MLDAYNHSSYTLNLIRSIINEGYTNIYNANEWDLSFIKDSNQIKEKQHFIKLVSTILDFMQYSDGLNNIREISKFIKQPLSKTKKIFLLLKKLKMVKIKEI